MEHEPWSAQAITTRTGLHVGEVTMMDMAGKADVVGLAADLAARVMGLAGGGQGLMTRGAFDEARAAVDRHPALDPDSIDPTTRTTNPTPAQAAAPNSSEPTGNPTAAATALPL